MGNEDLRGSERTVKHNFRKVIVLSAIAALMCLCTLVFQSSEYVRWDCGDASAECVERAYVRGWPMGFYIDWSPSESMSSRGVEIRFIPLALDMLLFFSALMLAQFVGARFKSTRS